MAVPMRRNEDDDEDNEFAPYEGNGLFEEEDYYETDTDDEGEPDDPRLPLEQDIYAAELSWFLANFESFVDYEIMITRETEELHRAVAGSYVTKFPAANLNLTNYPQLPQVPSWLQGGQSSQPLATRCDEIAFYLIECLLAIGRMLRFNADLLSKAIPGANLTNYPKMPQTPSWFRGGPPSREILALWDDYRTFSYESRIAHEDMVLFNVGMIPGFDPSNLPPRPQPPSSFQPRFGRQL